MQLTTGKRVRIFIFKCVNAIVPWHRLPKYVGALNLLAMRDELRHDNLHDTYPSWEEQGDAHGKPVADSNDTTARNSDGLYNDLEHPRMGCAGMRFGRNVPRDRTMPPNHEELMTPNPREVSRRLLARPADGFKPATIVNLLAAAWIQFQVHDWLQHSSSTDEHEIPLSADDPWKGGSMKVEKTQQDQILDDKDKKYPAYGNSNSKCALLMLDRANLGQRIGGMAARSTGLQRPSRRA